MAWMVLIATGVTESIWAIELGKSNNFSSIAPTIVF